MSTAIRYAVPVVAILLAGLPALGAAQEGENRAGHWYIGGGLGGFTEEDNPQISGQDAGFALLGSAGYRATPYVAVEATLLGSTQDFLTPASISGVLPGAEPRTDLNTSGLGALVKFILPLDSVDLFVGAGLGLFTTNLHTEGTVAEVDEDDTNLGLHAAAGADVFISRNVSVGLEYRWLKLEANFEPAIGGDIDVGGQFFFATVRAYF